MIIQAFALLQQAAAAAQGAPPPGGPAPSPGGGAASPIGGCGGGAAQLAPMLLIFVVFYFMLIRPQQKKQREQQDWLKTLKKGDEIVTNSGIIGKISGLTDDIVTIEVQEKVRMRILRSAVAGAAPGARTAAASTAPNEDKK